MENNDAFKTQAESLQEALNKLTQVRTEGLVRLKDVQSFGRVMLQREIRRLRRKLGPEHPRVVALNDALKKNQAVHQDLKAKLYSAALTPVSVSGDDTLLHGRVVDDYGRGVIGAKVTFTDASGKKIPIEEVSIDKTGYFAVIVTPNVMEKIKDKPVIISVVRDDGTVLYKHDEPLKMEAKKHKLVNIVVSREKAYPFSMKEVAKPKQPGGVSPPRKGAKDTTKASTLGKEKEPRYLGNSDKKELHDLTCLTANCRIEDIKAENRVPFTTQKEALDAGYDLCAHCFGKDKSKR